MAGIHNISRAGSESVSPDSLDGAASVDGDDLVGGTGRVGATVAGKVVGGHVSDGTIVGRGPDAVGDGVGGTAGLQLDEDGVGRGRGGGGEEGEDLHLVWLAGWPAGHSEVLTEDVGT